VAETVDPGSAAPAAMRRAWLAATVAATVCPFALAITLAPAAGERPVAALTWLLFVGSSVHVASTAWFYFLPEVRSHMARHRARYLWWPLTLVCGLAAITPMLSASALTSVLLVFFAWQFFHFQKQNLGVAALAARCTGAAALTRWERAMLIASGVGGIIGLLGHPALLQLATRRHADWVFAAGAVLWGVCLLGGAGALARRPARQRAAPFVILYLTGLTFFLPVFLFDSPYAAVAGLTIAHGLQYLLLLGLLAAAPSQEGARRNSLLILVNLSLVVGLALNRASHLHSSVGVGRAIFGAYLGLVSAHFIVDAGLWRLRDEFPRNFLSQRLPYLLLTDTAPHFSRRG
jgi:hypothetical protein